MSRLLYHGGVKSEVSQLLWFTGRRCLVPMNKAEIVASYVAALDLLIE
jgi:hypothetical protein